MRKSFASIVVILGAIIALTVIIGGGFFIVKSLSQKTLKQVTQTITPSNQPLSQTITQSPEKVVSSFYDAVHKRDKVLARTFLAPTANPEAFSSTLHDDKNSILYAQNFTYKITNSKVEANAKKAKVNADIILNGTTYQTEVSLENIQSKWLLTDAVSTSQGEPKIVLIRLNGPAQLYLTNVEGKHTGYDPVQKVVVNEIGYVEYQGVAEPKLLTIKDFFGDMQLKVVGTGTGPVRLITELFNPKNHQVGTIDGTISPGSVSTFNLSYPQSIGQPLVVNEVK